MEYLDVYDLNRQPLGRTIRRGGSLREGERCLAVHILIYNARGELLVQRRADGKEFAPGVWALTGGSVLAGETSAQACAREVWEELGFQPDMDRATIPISFMAPDAFVDVYAIRADVALSDLRVQKSEVAEVAWLNRESFLSLARDGRRFFRYAYLDLLIWILDGTGIWRGAGI